MKTVLSIGAHPDDIEIGCGGTELLLKEKGYKLIHVVITDGGEGNINIQPEQLAKVRRNEAADSARIIGADEIFFIGEQDGSTSFSKEVKIELIRLIRRFSPEIVFTHSSQDHFPDHVLVSQLTLAAIEGAKGPWYPNSGSTPHSVDTVLGYEVWHPMNRHHLAMNVTHVMDQKIQALNRHQSQLDGVDYLGAIKGLAQYRGATTMNGSFAEVFEVFKMGGLL